MFYVIAKYHPSYQGTRCSPFKYEKTFTVANSLRRNHILKLSRNYFIAVIVKIFYKKLKVIMVQMKNYEISVK